MGYYCPANSDLPKACDAPATCSSQGCVDKTSCNVPDDPDRGNKTFLTKLTDFLGGSLEAEFSVGLSIQIYTDVGAAPFNGSNGFGLDIDLPFNWLPTISLLYNSVPPFHCLFEGEDNDGNKLYKFAGIGLSTPLATSVPIRNNAATKEEALRDAAAIAKAGIVAESTRFKDRLKKFIQDVKEDKSSFRVSGESFGVGFGYSYDASFNEVEDRYDWSKVCGDAVSNPNPTTSPSKSPSKAPTVRPACFVSLLPPCHMLTLVFCFL